MSKYHILPWNIKEWWADKGVGRLSATARGVWFEWLQQMWYNRTYKLRGTYRELARDGRCTISQCRNTILQLKNQKVARVLARTKNGHTTVTLISRRYEKEHKERIAARERKRKERGGAVEIPVTDESQGGHESMSRSCHRHKTINHKPVTSTQQKRTCLCTQKQAEEIFEKWAVTWNSGDKRHRVRLRSIMPELNRSLVGCIRTLATDPDRIANIRDAILCICVDRTCNAFGSERWSWRPTFDWLLKDGANVDKVLAGAYDGEAPEQTIAERTAGMDMGGEG